MPQADHILTLQSCRNAGTTRSEDRRGSQQVQVATNLLLASVRCHLRLLFETACTDQLAQKHHSKPNVIDKLGGSSVTLKLVAASGRGLGRGLLKRQSTSLILRLNYPAATRRNLRPALTQSTSSLRSYTVARQGSDPSVAEAADRAPLLCMPGE